MPPRGHRHSQGFGNLPQVIAGQGRKKHGRQFKGVYQWVGAYQTTTAEKTHIKGDTVTNNRIITEEQLQIFRNRLKLRNIYQLLWSNSGEALHTIGNRTPRRNQRLHRVKYGCSLKFDGRYLKNSILLRMQPCRFQVKCHANGWLLRHKYSSLHLSRFRQTDFPYIML